MQYDPEKRHRRSIRLPGYDYTQPGAYFITVCVQNKACLFGEIFHGIMQPNEAGLMVESWWGNVTRRFVGVDVDAFAVMPNHFHGIVWLGTADTLDASWSSNAGRHGDLPLQQSTKASVGAGRRACPPDQHDGTIEREPSLSDIVGWFKSTTTKDYILGVNHYDWPPFRKRLWQRNYYEHIIRTDRALAQIRAYIDANPAYWPDDPEHPSRPPT